MSPVPVSCDGQPGNRSLTGTSRSTQRPRKAVVGFAEGQTFRLGSVTIEPQSRYAAIYVTAREADADLETSNNVLVVAIARARNSGMKIFNDDRILQRGTAPVVMEPVKARITLSRGAAATVHLLDHSGRKTGKTLPRCRSDLHHRRFARQDVLLPGDLLKVARLSEPRRVASNAVDSLAHEPSSGDVKPFDEFTPAFEQYLLLTSCPSRSGAPPQLLLLSTGRNG